MGNIDKPISREEMYYSYLLGDTSITLPEPITRRDRYLYELCKNSAGGGETGGITEEEADAKYALKENTVITGSFSQNRKAGTTVGENSHAEGEDTTASGYGSHAEGHTTTASGIYSHAEGEDTTASGDASNAEGLKSTASGVASHAEGLKSKASAQSSHAEGDGTTASGVASHAEGGKTTASAQGSHAEGSSSTALGYASHAEGVRTIASRKSQHVEGQYNIEDTEGENVNVKGKYIHIAGNGTSVDARSNAHTLDWEGNAEFSGDVTANGCGGEAPISLVEIANRLKTLEDKYGSLVNGNEVAY